MTWQNLLGISLDSIAPNRETIARLLAAAQRNLLDARLDALSQENRFDAAYKAIMQLAMLALHANADQPAGASPDRDPVVDAHHRLADGSDDRARRSAQTAQSLRLL